MRSSKSKLRRSHRNQDTSSAKETTTTSSSSSSLAAVAVASSKSSTASPTASSLPSSDSTSPILAIDEDSIHHDNSTMSSETTTTATDNTTTAASSASASASASAVVVAAASVASSSDCDDSTAGTMTDAIVESSTDAIATTTATPVKGNISAALRRLQSDLQEVQQQGDVAASPIRDDDLMRWQASIFGPYESPWEGGIFKMHITFTDSYPAQPPVVRFVTHMFHPNVYPDGTLCLDIIQDKWSPIYTVTSIIQSIQSLLTDPNPKSPANPEAAQLFSNDKKEYKKRVRRCAEASSMG